MSDLNYEYPPINTLTGTAAHYFTIPKCIIEGTELDYRRVSLFVYLRCYKGLNDHLCFSVPLFLKWANLKNDTHPDGVNEKIITLLDSLNDFGYITYCSDRAESRTFCIDILFNSQQVFDECAIERFAIVYIDEVEKIMQYKNLNPKDSYFNCNAVLLVFAYLRMAIARRPNKLKPEERFPKEIKERRERLPEAYNDTYKDIAATLGLSVRAVSKAVDVLKELGLIHVREAYHIKNELDEYRTPDMIFANMQKRDKNYLLIEGVEYANSEVENKAKLINKHNKKYVLKGDKQNDIYR